MAKLLTRGRRDGTHDSMKRDPTSSSTGVAAGLVRRLKRRRQDLGATVSRLAEWSGIDQARLTELEKSAEGLSSSEFEQWCRGLAVAPGAFWAGKDQDPRRGVVRFKTAGAPAERLSPDDLRLLSLAGEVGRIVGGLLMAMDRPVRLEGLRRVHPIRPSVRPGEDGYRLAEEARRTMELGADVLFDLDDFLRGLGVCVAEVVFSIDAVEAASVWEPGMAPVMLVNSSAPRCRNPLARRAVLAHELCHLLHDAGENDLCTLVSWAEGEGNYTQAVEQRARGFAPAFLAPPGAVRLWWDDRGTGSGTRGECIVAAMASHWGLSWEGSAYHAGNTLLISKTEARDIANSRPPRSEEEALTAASLAFRPKLPAPTTMDIAGEPVDVTPLVGRFGLSVVSDSLDKGLITSARAREILTWQ